MSRRALNLMVYFATLLPVAAFLAALAVVLWWTDYNEQRYRKGLDDMWQAQPFFPKGALLTSVSTVSGSSWTVTTVTTEAR